MAYFTEAELQEIQNYLVNKGIACDSVSTAVNDTDEIPATDSEGNGKHFTISQLKGDLKNNVSVEVDATNNRKYVLKLYDTEVANFTVPVDKFIKSVSYNESTKKLVFVFYKADETEETVYVDISSLVDIYTAGNGLQVSSNKFSIKIKSGETVLKASADGAYTDVSTLQANIDKKLPLAGGTMTGTINSQSVIPKANDTYDLGSSSNEFKNAFLQRLATIYFSLGGVELNDAGFHNTIPRCANVTKYITDGSLYNRMQGSGYKLFDDLYVGDYFTTGSKTIAGDTHDRWWQFLGFDYFLRCGGSDITKHHAVIAPCTFDGQGTSIICSMAMYDSTPFTQGYLGSKPCQAMLGAQTVSGTTYSEGSIATTMKEIFGDHIIPTQELLNTTNEGTNWQWYTMYGSLMSEIEVYGARIWGVDSGYDNLMSARGQLPLFMLKPSLISTRSFHLWLRSVGASSTFAAVYDTGFAADGTATLSRGIRPRFLIG